MTSERDPGVPDEPLVRPLGDDRVEGGAQRSDEDGAAAPEPVAETGPQPSHAGRRNRADSHNMLPPRERRRSGFERFIVRLIATCGIIGIGVAIGAIMVSNGSQGWVVGLVVSIVSVVLAGLLWSSRQL